MTKRLILPCLVGILAFSLTACHGGKPQARAQKPSNPAFFEGRATVLEVRNELGYTLLRVDGQDVYGYWEPDPAFSQGGTITRSGAFGTAVGEAKDPVVHHQDFPGKVGDTIAFRGMQTGGDIYLSAVQVLSR